ncbi:MAG: hypothetical protein HDR13_07775 [Lachnospiraceae bacterium]|nr:hypothetical protein [Lachnospiraceae bacterium]
MKAGSVCPACGKEQREQRYFCEECGTFLDTEMFDNKELYELPEIKIKRILENLKYTPHSKIPWDDTVDFYVKKVEAYRALTALPELATGINKEMPEKLEHFLKLCRKQEFQIAFVGTIKTGKSTLINALLGHNYASMAVTPETAALTKFRSSQKDYIRVDFYTTKEWDRLWKSRTSAADAFMKEYEDLGAEAQKGKWVGHAPIIKEVANEDIEKELAVWSSSKRAEHYFVREIEVGISSLPDDFPKQVVFVDTPGLSDPVAYRSEITRQYIRNANAVFVCVEAKKLQKEEIDTIASVFSFSSHNKGKVHIIATHWDELNHPEKEWKEQKKWMKKQLVGKGFFDVAEMAETNITHSAAYIYNLCRDYAELGKDEKKPLMKFAFEMDMDYEDLKNCLPDMMKLANIGVIEGMIREKLAGNYLTLLCQDIEREYKDIIYTLKRSAMEKKKETKKIIDVSYASMKEVEEKLEEQKRNYEELMANKEQLNKALHMVEESTKKRLDQILTAI